MPSSYDYWLFDLDGTLVDVSPWYVHDVITRVGEAIDYDFSDHQAERLWHGLGGSPEYLLERWDVDPTSFWEAFHRIESAEDRAAATFLYPDAERIGALEAPVGLVTHCQPYLTTPVLEHLDICDWFDTIVCSNDTIGWKPDPGPIKHAQSALPISNGESGVLIGDSAADIGAAWRAGLDGIHIERHGTEKRGCCIRADRHIETLSSVVDGGSRRSTPDSPS